MIMREQIAAARGFPFQRRPAVGGAQGNQHKIRLSSEMPPKRASQLMTGR